MQLKDFGVTEMSEIEMKDVDGGIIPFVILGAVIYVIVDNL